LRLVFVARISPRKAHASIPYVFPEKYTSSTGFSISGVTYGTRDSRVSNFRVAALMAKMCGSAVDGGLDRSCVVVDIEDRCEVREPGTNEGRESHIYHALFRAKSELRKI
jgi:hypothetical protein